MQALPALPVENGDPPSVVGNESDPLQEAFRMGGYL
jgi:hypothetical protein